MNVPFEVYEGKLERTQLSLLVSGTDPHHGVDNVANVPATLMTYLAIEKYNPDLVVNVGTAGGIAERGCEIGDVYLSSGLFTFHDRRIPLPRFEQYGLGQYTSYDTSVISKELQLKTGSVSTGNSLDLLEKDMQLIKKSGAIIKDMEAAAIAWVCQTLSVPLMSIKAITDLIDKSTPTEIQFMENLHQAVTNLQIKTVEVLELLDSAGILKKTA
ncbi:hypothetical protein LA52FAK_38970 [Desulforhopalus sp. 52FAK]